MTIKKEMILRKIGADVILVPLGNALKEHNGLFMLSDSAYFLWEKLPECNSVKELADALYNEYEVSQGQALEDTQEFINKLVELEIIDKL